MVEGRERDRRRKCGTGETIEGNSLAHFLDNSDSYVMFINVYFKDMKFIVSQLNLLKFITSKQKITQKELIENG